MQSQTTPPWYECPCNVWRKSVKTTQIKSPETTFLHRSRAITLLFTNEFSPFAIPNHSSPISMSMQNLKKSVKNYSSQSTETKRWRTDGWTDTQKFKIFGGYHIIPRHFLCGGYKKEKVPNQTIKLQLMIVVYMANDGNNVLWSEIFNWLSHVFKRAQTTVNIYFWSY